MKFYRRFLAAFLALLILLPTLPPAEAASAESADPLALYPLRSFTVSYPYDSSGTTYEKQTSVPYSPALFLQDARELSPELARLGVALSTAAYDWLYVSRALGKMGFHVDSSWSATYDRDMTVFDNHYVAYCIGTDTVSVSEDTYIIYCVPVRGTVAQEWYSDFVLSTDDVHEGFRIAAEEVYGQLAALLQADDFDADHTAVFLTGHSRGAAVSNLVAGWLTEDAAVPLAKEEHIFSYNFACPNVSKSADTTMRNICNFNNPGDLIPLLPLDSWGYQRYGRSFSTIDELNRSNLEQQFLRMTETNFSCEPTSEHYTKLLDDLFPSVGSYKQPMTQLALNLAAWWLSEGSIEELPDLFIKSGVEAGKYTIKDLQKTAAVVWAKTKAGELLEVCDALIDFVDEHTAAVPSMTAEEFTAFLQNHSDTIARIEEITEHKIISPTDFLSIRDILLTRKILTETISDVILNAAKLFLDENGFILNKVVHGHCGITYVLWVNSLFYGYKGWYGYTAEDNLTHYADPNSELLQLFDPSGTCENAPQYLSLGDSCFEMSTGVTALILPNSLRYLGNQVCRKATGLKGAIIIPDGVSAISDQAFYLCSGIMAVSLPASISFSSLSDNSQAFVGCTGITHVRLTGTGPMAPQNHACTPWARGSAAGNDVTVEISEGVTSISSDAFSFCENLISVSIPESVTSIGSGAFAECYRLEQADLPSSLTSIGQQAFQNCRKLRTSSLPGTVTRVPPSLYYNCRSLEQVTLGSGLTSIGESAFSGCSSLRELTIPDTVTTVYNYAFYNCSSITHLTMPASLPLINSSGYNSGTFLGCTGITRVTLTGSGAQARCDGVCAPWRKASDAGRQVTVEISDGITGISASAFYECQNLAAIRIPESVTSIGSSAFYGCSGLEQVFYYGNEAQWGSVQIAQNNAPLLNALIYFNSRYLQAGSIGENKSLHWKYEGDTGTLTVSGAAAEETPLFAAVYDGGKFVELRIFTSAREAEAFVGQFDLLKLFWLGADLLPLWNSTDVMLP